MRFEERGSGTSGVELSNVSAHGMWLLIDERELYLSFDEFPWFRDASVKELADVERPQGDHLFWPQLDVDLSVGCIEDPSRYPLVSGRESSKVAEAD